ncbi:EI24 domain-containing protein [Vacuolonema iberomarrocanum]|uniref:EI24 domain-containing protein n=1 Tax=Vacuolonema iberomarrocanum TaxID=3454632 RepID=UPI001A027A6F|nr:EI24 domain-containing protein [filamentous cyanobacterium LEGE 07170]
MNQLLRLPAGLVAGFVYPLRALWTLLRNPPLRKYVLIPIAINFVLGITLYAGLLTAGLGLIDAIAQDVPNWTAEIPTWATHVPDWRFTLPAWVTLPAWATHFPHWHLNLPDWHITAPSWLHRPDWLHFPNWLRNLSFSLPEFSLPNWRPTLPDWFASIPNWLAIALLWVLRLVLTVILLILTGWILLQFGVLLGAPWYGKLSEELERRQTGQMTLVEVSVTQDIWRAIAYELKKLVLSLGLGLPILLLSFVPLIAAIAAPISIAIASILVCLDFMDGALERRRLRFRDKLGIYFKNLPATASFGIVCLFFVSIPLINLVAIPICVTAGTLFFCDWIYPSMKNRQFGSSKPKTLEGTPPQARKPKGNGEAIAPETNSQTPSGD